MPIIRDQVSFLSLQLTPSREQIIPLISALGFPIYQKWEPEVFFSLYLNTFITLHTSFSLLWRKQHYKFFAPLLLSLHHTTCQLFPLMHPWNKFNFGNYLEHGSWTQLLWTLLLSIFSFSSWFHCPSPTCQVGNHSFNKCPQWACMPCWPRSPGRSVNPSNFAHFHSHAQSPKCRPWPQSCQLCYTRQEFSFMRAKNEISEY